MPESGRLNVQQTLKAKGRKKTNTHYRTISLLYKTPHNVPCSCLCWGLALSGLFCAPPHFIWPLCRMLWSQLLPQTLIDASPCAWRLLNPDQQSPDPSHLSFSTFPTLVPPWQPLQPVGQLSGSLLAVFIRCAHLSPPQWVCSLRPRN